MSLQDRRRERLRRESAPYLQDGETFKGAFAAGGRYADAVVVATDRRILVLDASQLVLIKVKGIRKELPKGTTFGPPKGAMFAVPEVGPREYVGRAWFFGVREVDADASTPTDGSQ